MKSVLIDLTGMTFGNLTVIKRIVKRKNKGIFWRCTCSCGNVVTVDGHSLKRGTTRSCGCLHKNIVSSMFYVHGGEPKRLYSIWNTMKTRCYNCNAPHYYMYGGRGIKVCTEWEHNFIAFRDWALSNGYSDNLTIDRIDNSGNYTPENCRWVTYKTQANNTRRNKYVSLNGETHTISEWSRITGIGLSCLYSRYRKNLPPEEILKK